MLVISAASAALLLLPSPLAPTRPRHPPVVAAASELFANANWPGLKRSLNALPCFTCANAEGQPLQYEVDGVPNAIFYVDFGAAKRELELANDMHQDITLGVIPFGVGDAYQLSKEGKALLVPSADEIVNAGAPEGSSPTGQEVPLFGCMEMSRPGPDGAPILPLFMCRGEAVAALDGAIETDDEGGAGLEVMCLSLTRALELLVKLEADNGADRPAGFEFVPPAASMDHIASFMKSSDAEAEAGET